MDFENDDENPIRISRRPKLSRHALVEDHEKEFEELETLINENVASKKKDHELDDDDLLLIEENKKMGRIASKRKRVKILDSDSDEEIHKRRRPQAAEYDDLNDFIVEDMNSKQDRHQLLASENRIDEYSQSESDEVYESDIKYNRSAVYAEDHEEARPDVFAVLDPAEIERSHFGKVDMEICLNDIPERMQRRSMPVTECKLEELEEEAAWIYVNSFNKPSLFSCVKLNENIKASSQSALKEAIKTVLGFIRNDKFDIPFIMHYRKEAYRSVLVDCDLWEIFHMDNEWMHLVDRRNKLISLMTQMVNFQQYITNNNIKCPIDLGLAIQISEIDTVQSLCDYDDMRDHYEAFSFRYMSTLRKLNSFFEKLLPLEELQKIIVVNLNEQKAPESMNYYDYCKRHRLFNMIEMIGISAGELGENISETCPKNIPDRQIIGPEEAATEYINGFLVNERTVIDHVIKLWAEELSHNPRIRGEARKFYLKNAKISCHPTPLGRSTIDSVHPYSEFKYLKNKPVEAFTPEQYLQLQFAESQGLLTSNISVYNQNNQTFVDFCRPFFERDEQSQSVVAWNQLRYKSFQACIENLLFPEFAKELKRRMNLEAQLYIVDLSCKLLRNHLGMALDLNKSESHYIFAISLPPFQSLKSHQTTNINDGYCSVVSSDGALVETFILDSSLLVASFTHSEYAKIHISKSLHKLNMKIDFFKPLSIVLTSQIKSVLQFAQYLQTNLVDKLDIKDKPTIEVVNHLIPNLAAMSILYKKEFPDMCSHEKHAISAARYSIDPLLEIAQMFEYQDDIVTIFTNQYSHSISKELLFSKYEEVLVDAVNLVGIDLRRCSSDYRHSNLLKYISGLGPSKAAHLLGMLRKRKHKVKHRFELQNELKVGEKVFYNCVGFIKIPSEIEVCDDMEAFDSTRIHPESYDLAKEIICSALKVDNPNKVSYAEAMLKLLVKPHRLQILDYDTFKENSQIIKQGQDKHYTFEDIKSEIISPFDDKRSPYHALTDEELFWVSGTNGVYFDRGFIKDPLNPLAPGNLVSGTITSYAYSKPVSNKIRDMVHHEEGSDNYLCPFCKECAFKTVDEVVSHCESSCNAMVIGVRVRLENGLQGFIPKDNILRDKKENIKEKLQVGMIISARIISVNEKKYSLELSYKSDESFGFKHGDKGKDLYYDSIMEKVDAFKQQELKDKLSNRVVYHKKLVVHPLFKNITYSEAEEMLKGSNDLDCIIRPSSKGVDKLSLSIKIIDDIIIHIEIREEEKINDYSLGKKLFIQTEMFEDLDEIYANYVTPYLNYFAEVTKNKAYLFVKESDQSFILSELKKQMIENPKCSPCLVSISRSYPGKVFVAYLHSSTIKLQYVTISNRGFSMNNVMYQNLESVLTYIKSKKQEIRPTPAMDKSKGFTPRQDHTPQSLSKFPTASQGKHASNTPKMYTTPGSIRNWPR